MQIFLDWIEFFEHGIGTRLGDHRLGEGGIEMKDDLKKGEL